MNNLKDFENIKCFYITKETCSFCFGYYYDGEDKVYVRMMKKKYSQAHNKEIKHMSYIFDLRREIEAASIINLFQRVKIDAFYDEILSEVLQTDTPYFNISFWLRGMYSDVLQQ